MFSTDEAIELKKLPISNQIKKLRFLNGEMTQKELADKVGVTRQTIVAIENCKYSPTLLLAFEIAQVFDENLDGVFTYEQADQ